MYEAWHFPRYGMPYEHLSFVSEPINTSWLRANSLLGSSGEAGNKSWCRGKWDVGAATWGGYVARESQGQIFPVGQLLAGVMPHDGDGEKALWKFNFLFTCFSACWLKYWDVFLSLEHSNPLLLPPPPAHWNLRPVLSPQWGSSPPCLSLSCPQWETKNSSQPYRVLGNFNSSVWIKLWALWLGSAPCCKTEQHLYQWICRTRWYILKVMKLYTFNFAIKALLRAAAFTLLHCWESYRGCVWTEGKCLPFFFAALKVLYQQPARSCALPCRWGCSQHGACTEVKERDWSCTERQTEGHRKCTVLASQAEGT